MAYSTVLHSVANNNSLTHFTAIGDDDDIFPIPVTIISLLFIKALSLKGYTYRSTAGQEIWIQLFNNFSSRGAKSTLKQVRFDHCYSITYVVLLAMGSVSSIVDVSLFGTNCMASRDIKVYFEKLDKKVTKLHMDDMFIICDDVLIAVGNISSLQQLTLQRLNNVTRDGIMDLIRKDSKRKCTLLKLLQIVLCSAVTQEVMKYIKYEGKLNNVLVEGETV